MSASAASRRTNRECTIMAHHPRTCHPSRIQGESRDLVTSVSLNTNSSQVTACFCYNINETDSNLFRKFPVWWGLIHLGEVEAPKSVSQLVRKLSPAVTVDLNRQLPPPLLTFGFEFLSKQEVVLVASLPLRAHENCLISAAS